MNKRTYFLINDTRYDNHHGGLTVIRNLHRGMTRRGWTCVGSLPVSASSRQLRRHRQALRAARLIVVNGEGSLHHNSRNTRRLLGICTALQATHPLALLNAVWQDNDAAAWKPVLDRFAAVYARDRRSQKQLRSLGVGAGYAPDLTFYDYPRFAPQHRSRLLCTDSVLKAWTDKALRWCEADDEIDFVTLFTGDMRYLRGPRDWSKRVKYRLYPALWKTFKVHVPPRYRALPHAIRETSAFLETLAACTAVCVARYHGLCFALQQTVPFVVVASNSHKSESLLEEAGLPMDAYLVASTDIGHIKARLRQAILNHPTVQPRIEEFNRRATQHIDEMFDQVAGSA